MAANRRELGVAGALVLSILAACRVPCPPQPPPCQRPDTLLSSAEANEEGRVGAVWYTALDSPTLTATSPDSAPYVEGGAEGSARAAGISGKSSSREPGFARVGLELDADAMAAVPRGSAALGFWTKTTLPVASQMRLTVTSANGDTFTLDTSVATGWVSYTIPFEALRPASSNRSSTVLPSELRRIEWRLTIPYSRFDLAVDDVIVFGCVPHHRPICGCFP